MVAPPPRSTLTDSLFPYTTPFRSAQTIAQREGPERGQRCRRPDREPGRGLFIGGVAVAPLAYVVEAVVIATEHVAAQGDVPVEHVRLRKAQVHRFRIARIIDACAQFLALAAEIAFGDRQIDDELFKAGENCLNLQLASGLFLEKIGRASCRERGC